MSILEQITGNATLGAALAGAAGGMVRWMTLRDNWKEGMANVVVGALCAIYLGPVAVQATERFSGVPITGDTENLGAFLVGLFGMALTGFLIDAMKLARQRQGDADE